MGLTVKKGSEISGMQLFCLQFEASCLQLSFFAYDFVWELSEAFPAYNLSFSTYNLSFSTYNWSFFACNAEVPLIST